MFKNRLKQRISRPDRTPVQVRRPDQVVRHGFHAYNVPFTDSHWTPVRCDV